MYNYNCQWIYLVIAHPTYIKNFAIYTGAKFELPWTIVVPKENYISYQKHWYIDAQVKILHKYYVKYEYHLQAIKENISKNTKMCLILEG